MSGHCERDNIWSWTLRSHFQLQKSVHTPTAQLEGDLTGLEPASSPAYCANGKATYISCGQNRTCIARKYSKHNMTNPVAQSFAAPVPPLKKHVPIPCPRECFSISTQEYWRIFFTSAASHSRTRSGMPYQLSSIRCSTSSATNDYVLSGLT